MLLKAQAIAKAFGPVKVLTDVSLQINEGDAIGLIGVNGAGKSTFLKILLGEMKPDTGDIIRNTERIGYLEQFAESSAEYTVRDVLGRPYGHSERIRRRLAEIDGEMAKGGDIDWNALAEENAELEGKLAKFDREIDGKLSKVFEQVNFPKDIIDLLTTREIFFSLLLLRIVTALSASLKLGRLGVATTTASSAQATAR